MEGSTMGEVGALLCPLCLKRRPRTEDGRKVCDYCLGLLGAADYPPESEKEKAMPKLSCPTHGPHEGTVIGRNKTKACPACVMESRKAPRKKKPAKAPNGGKIPPTETPSQECVEPEPEIIPVILTSAHFKECGCAGMIDQIRKNAKEDLRPVHRQIIWYLKQVLDNGRGVQVLRRPSYPEAAERPLQPDAM